MRESLFELLGPRIGDAKVLDLCSGSGAVGIEALSRGAGHVTFVDRSAKMCNVVKTNLELCGIPRGGFEIVEDEVSHFLTTSALAKDVTWDIVFFDPPYEGDYAPVIEILSTERLLRKKRGVLVVEHGIDNVLSDRYLMLQRWRILRQGESCLSFYEKKR